MELVEMMARSCETTGQVLSKVVPGQYSDPTPCAEWDVRAEANHIVGTAMMGANVAARKPAQDSHGGELPDFIGDNPGGAFSKAADSLIEAWRQPGALDGNVNLGSSEMPASMAAGIFLFDTFVHGWDVAKATGQDTSVFDTNVAEAVLEVAQQIVSSDSRGEGRSFGPEIQVAEGASALERLVAFTGREL